jgi:enoyl-CoA hydratase/carnithine racemase
LVDHVVPRAELMTKCESIADAICRGAPLAVEKIRAAALRGLDLPLADGLELERANLAFLRTTADATEGAAAFSEKRPPNWRGR